MHLCGLNFGRENYIIAACEGDLPPEGEVVIFHTNDTHGYLAGDGESVVGIDRVAALHEQTENSIFIDASDAMQGLPIASLTQGADVIELMNEAGYDLMAAGNHEFDFGSEVLLENAARAAFPILSANAVKDGEPLLQSERSNGCHTIVEADGIRVGFFGLTTADTQGSVNRELLDGVTFADEVQTAREATVDGDGFIEIVLADGAHGIRLAGGDEDAYIDNYLGFGLVEDAFRAWPQLSLLRP